MAEVQAKARTKRPSIKELTKLFEDNLNAKVAELYTCKSLKELRIKCDNILDSFSMMHEFKLISDTDYDEIRDYITYTRNNRQAGYNLIGQLHRPIYKITAIISLIIMLVSNLFITCMLLTARPAISDTPRFVFEDTTITREDTRLQDLTLYLEETIAERERLAAIEAAKIPSAFGYELKLYEKYSVDGANRLTDWKGVVYFNGHKETWYSEKVLPGGGLNIPGRHVANDGTIRDKDGYICVASDLSYLPRYSTVLTSLGPAKVYDTGCAYGTIDIYVNW